MAYEEATVQFGIGLVELREMTGFAGLSGCRWTLRV